MALVEPGPARLFLGQKHGASSRDLGEVRLGAYLLQRVAQRDPALGGVIDPTWSLTEVFVLRAVDGAVPDWERRVAKELTPELADDIGGEREIVLSGVPTTIGSTFAAAPPPVEAVAAFAAWLDSVRDESGRLTEAAIVRGLREAHFPVAEQEELGALAFGVGRAKAKPVDLAALEDEVRRLFGAELPAEYLMFLRDVGALRLETIAEGKRTSLGEVVLPAKAIVEALRTSWVASLREADQEYVPFFRFDDERYDAFDISCDPAPVVRLEDGNPVTHRSFSAWLEAWRAGGLRAREIRREANAQEPPRLTTAAAIVRRWAHHETWVRPMYERAG